MFYSLLKLYARFAFKIYCRRVVISHPELLKTKGPVLFAANHPNSFLDGIVLTTLYDGKLNSLARGDAFKNKWINKYLRSIRLLPVYRTSEGVENLEHNYTTFDACLEIFEKEESVLIFSEGRCENEWHLRPLKKGTARLAFAAWDRGVDLWVIPTAFNYSSFKKFGKEIHLSFGNPIHANIVAGEENSGKRLLLFNEALKKELSTMVYEIGCREKERLKRIFQIKINPSIYLLGLPAVAGFILHAPLFYSCKLFTRARFRNSGHYDSVLVSLLLLSYPFYLLMFMIAGLFYFPISVPFLLVLMPLTARACVEVKYQMGL